MSENVFLLSQLGRCRWYLVKGPKKLLNSLRCIGQSETKLISLMPAASSVLGPESIRTVVLIRSQVKG